MKVQTGEKAIIQQVLQGNPQAFNALVAKYQTKVRYVVRRYIGDPCASDDVTQEVFLEAFKALPRFRGDSAFYTWLYQIACNLAKNYLRQRCYLNCVSLEEDSLSEYTTPEQCVACDELQHALITVINHMPEELRLAIVLREFIGLSYQDIAHRMDCPIGTVRSRLARARLLLAEHVDIE